MYPHTPGWKVTDTSRDAAIAIQPCAKTISDIVYRELRECCNGLTTHELSEITGIPYSALQPRTSELRNQDKIVDSGARRKGASGKNIIVWQVKDEQGEMFQ